MLPVDSVPCVPDRYISEGSGASGWSSLMAIRSQRTLQTGVEMRDQLIYLQRHRASPSVAQGCAAEGAVALNMVSPRQSRGTCSGCASSSSTLTTKTSDKLLGRDIPPTVPLSTALGLSTGLLE
jgi:Fe-S cluster biogenesis protein NfuA